MIFLIDNLKWSPTSVAELYSCRWQIEVFFKQLNQPLQLAHLSGNNANPVKITYMDGAALYVLLRFQVW